MAKSRLDRMPSNDLNEMEEIDFIRVISCGFEIY